MTPAQAQAFLGEAAQYFRNRPTNGEDRSHWANVYNAENCEKVAALIASLSGPTGSTDSGSVSTAPASNSPSLELSGVSRAEPIPDSEVNR